jgi:hypothetical protein
MKPLITVFEEYELIETETMKKSRLVREFEVIEVSFCFSSLKRFETFVEVTEYEKHGVNAPIWQKLRHSQINGSTRIYFATESTH